MATEGLLGMQNLLAATPGMDSMAATAPQMPTMPAIPEWHPYKSNYDPAFEWQKEQAAKAAEEKKRIGEAKLWDGFSVKAMANRRGQVQDWLMPKQARFMELLDTLQNSGEDLITTDGTLVPIARNKGNQQLLNEALTLKGEITNTLGVEAQNLVNWDAKNKEVKPGKTRMNKGAMFAAAASDENDFNSRVNEDMLKFGEQGKEMAKKYKYAPVGTSIDMSLEDDLDYNLLGSNLEKTFKPVITGAVSAEIDRVGVNADGTPRLNQKVISNKVKTFSQERFATQYNFALQAEGAQYSRDFQEKAMGFISQQNNWVKRSMLPKVMANPYLMGELERRTGMGQATIQQAIVKTEPTAQDSELLSRVMSTLTAIGDENDNDPSGGNQQVSDILTSPITGTTKSIYDYKKVDDMLDIVSQAWAHPRAITQTETSMSAKFGPGGGRSGGTGGAAAGGQQQNITGEYNFGTSDGPPIRVYDIASFTKSANALGGSYPISNNAYTVSDGVMRNVNSTEKNSYPKSVLDGLVVLPSTLKANGDYAPDPNGEYWGAYLRVVPPVLDKMSISAGSKNAKINLSESSTQSFYLVPDENQYAANIGQPNAGGLGKYGLSTVRVAKRKPDVSVKTQAEIDAEAKAAKDAAAADDKAAVDAALAGKPRTYSKPKQ